MASPVQVNATGDADIGGILWGWKWDTRSFTYSFPSSSAEYLNNGYAGVYEFESFSAVQRAAVKTILGNIASFANVTFEDVTGSDEVGLFRFAEASQINYSDDPNVTSNTGWHVPGNTSAEANPPELGYLGNPPASNPAAQGDGWYTHGLYDDPRKGSFAYCAGLMHETGHNLGLKHGHNAQYGHGTLFPKLPFDHDSLEYSVMTYSQFPGDSEASDSALNHPTTYMQNDILALQMLYGANYRHQSGNTVYKWSATTGEMFLNGVGQGAPEDNHILMTVWDGGGRDTYDLSNFTRGTIIDLRPGAWTTTSTAQLADLGTDQTSTDHHFARGNVANAQLFQGNVNSLIEDAVGGSGNDRITGNQANNVLDGRKGADSMSGQAGDDTYRVDNAGDRIIEAAGRGKDTVFASVSYTLAAGQEIEQLRTTDDAGTAALTLTGNAFANRLVGNAGANLINGGLGLDTLFGKAGQDTFVFANTPSAGNLDHLGDFSAADDTIRLSKGIFSALAPGQLTAVEFKDIAKAKVDASDHILYDSRTGDLFYDADGSGKATAVKFAVLDNKAALTAADFFVV